MHPSRPQWSRAVLAWCATFGKDSRVGGVNVILLGKFTLGSTCAANATVAEPSGTRMARYWCLHGGRMRRAARGCSGRAMARRPRGFRMGGQWLPSRWRRAPRSAASSACLCRRSGPTASHHHDSTEQQRGSEARIVHMIRQPSAARPHRSCRVPASAGCAPGMIESAEGSGMIESAEGSLHGPPVPGAFA